MKSEQLQIRLTPAQKAALRRLARRAGQDVSQYVLAKLLPDASRRFGDILGRLAEETDERYALADLNDLLAGLAADELGSLPGEGLGRLPPATRCRVAAMVEQACVRAGAEPPAWTPDEPPLDAPAFAVPLRSLRLHLLKSSPVAFRRRNIFVDASVGDRV